MGAVGEEGCQELRVVNPSPSEGAERTGGNDAQGQLGWSLEQPGLESLPMAERGGVGTG